MDRYKCEKCGYIEDGSKINDNYICPICGAPRKEFKPLIIENIIKDEIEAIVETVVQDASSDKKSKIINSNEEDKRVTISQYNNAIMRINEKCINCGQCKKTCENIQNISYDLNVCKNPICVGCGQCVLNCPTGALVPKYCYREVKNIINANDKIVVALTSPGVRVSLGDNFELEMGENVEGRMVTALKKLGFDYVFDTAFGADLTVMEEVSELIARISNNGPLPLFTSCCPAWVKYAEVYHSNLLKNISTCKSPIGMQCAMIKSYFAQKKSIDPLKIITVAITPCTAKKIEAREYVENVDYVLTANELSLLLKEEDIKLDQLPNGNFDSVMGTSSGAGTIFGNTGGVTEAVVRTIYRIMTGTSPKGEELILQNVRGMKDIKQATIDINGKKIKVAVVNGINNLSQILEEDKYKKFHFIEVMNCKGGCVGGGGQPLTPISKMEEIKLERQKSLYEIDKERTTRSAHDNPEIKTLYKEFLKTPLSETSLKYLHTSFSDKSELLK